MFTKAFHHRSAPCVLFWLLALLCLGCGEWTVIPSPDVTPIKREAHAAKCLDEYGRSLARIFRDAAEQIRDGTTKITDVAESMGNAQRDARVEAFLPLMERLDECEDADAMAIAMRQFADQLEGR